MTDKRISPLQWLSTKFASLNHSHSEYLTSHQDITGKEDKSNKVTGVLSNSNTDTEYPSAKSVMDTLVDFDGYVEESFAPKYLLDYKENLINKSSSITTDTGSTSKYPTVKAVEDYAQPKGNYLTQHQSLKTINNETITGTGNISITGGSGTVDSTWVTNSTNPVQSQLIKSALDGKANTTHTHSPSQVESGISSADWKLGYMQGDGSTQEYFNQSVNYEIDDIWNEFSSVYNIFNDYELVSLKTDDISQLTSNTQYYPSAKGVADYITYITPRTNLSDFNDDLDYLVDVSMDNVNSGISINQMQTVGINYYVNANNEITQSLFNRAILEEVGSIETELDNRIRTSYIADNLTTNDATKVLSAKQGKALNDLIGNAITYINQ